MNDISQITEQVEKAKKLIIEIEDILDGVTDSLEGLAALEAEKKQMINSQ